MQSIPCKECGYSNESQRVYCHNCGAKLDRSALIDEARKPKKPQRPASAIDWSGLLVGGMIGFFKCAVAALLVAMIIQAVRVPDGTPQQDELGGVIVDAPSLMVELESATSQPSRLIYTEPALTAYLNDHIKPTKDTLVPVWLAKHVQAFVNLGDGGLRISREFQVLSRPFYIGGTYEATIVDGRLKVRVLGGNVGRLPLTAPVFDLMDNLIFKGFDKEFEEERKALDRMKSLTVTPQSVEIISG